MAGTRSGFRYVSGTPVGGDAPPKPGSSTRRCTRRGSMGATERAMICEVRSYLGSSALLILLANSPGRSPGRSLDKLGCLAKAESPAPGPMAEFASSIKNAGEPVFGTLSSVLFGTLHAVASVRVSPYGEFHGYRDLSLKRSATRPLTRRAVPRQARADSAPRGSRRTAHTGDVSTPVWGAGVAPPQRTWTTSPRAPSAAQPGPGQTRPS
jgi:hypothetical protein